MQKKPILIVVALIVVLALAGFFIFGNKGKTSSGHKMAGASGAGSAVTAEVKPVDGTKSWVLRCDKFKDVKEGQRQEYCEVFIRALVKDTGQRIFEFAVGYPEADKAARGVFILPLGLVLDSPLSLKLDGQPPLAFKIRYCTGDGCYAFVTLDDALLGKLRSSKALAIEGSAQNGQPVKLEIPMDEFAKAMVEPRLKP
ncbi:MAG: hypothetical protein GC136_01830 [Alphaproteobacteria bacterium]|nr:hypothetical protein [Alphaproteobacteria bacterium]